MKVFSINFQYTSANPMGKKSISHWISISKINEIPRLLLNISHNQPTFLSVIRLKCLLYTLWFTNQNYFYPINISKKFTALWFDHSKYAPFSKWTLYDIEAESVLLLTAISIKVYLKNKHAASSLVFEVFVTVYIHILVQ